MASETIIRIGSIVSSSGNASVEGTNSALSALSDFSTTTGLLLPQGQLFQYSFRMNADDIAQIPDGLVTGVSLFVDCDYQQTVTRFIRQGQVIFENVATNETLWVNAGLAKDLSRGSAQPKRGSDGPVVTGIDDDDLRYEQLNVTFDTTRLKFPSRVYTLYLRVQTNAQPVITAGGTIFGGDKPTIFFGFNDPEGQDLEASKYLAFDEATASRPDFDPETATPVQASGIVYGPTPSIVFSEPFEINKAYRVYMAASEVGSNGRFTKITRTSPFVPVNIVADPGPIPVVRAAHKANPSRVEIEVASNVNLLSEAASRLSAITTSSLNALGGYLGQLSTNISLSRARRRITFTSTNTLTVGTDVPVEVKPNVPYSGAFRLFTEDASSSSIAVYAELQFLNAVGIEVGRYSGPTHNVYPSTYGATTVHVSAFAPAQAATVRLWLRSNTSVERTVSISTAQIVRDLAVNYIVNPLLNHGDGAGAAYWTPWDTLNAGPIQTRSFISSIFAGDQSARYTSGNTNGLATGLAQSLVLPIGSKKFAIMAIVRASKDTTISINHPQFQPVGYGLRANEITLVQGVRDIAAFTSGQPKLTISTQTPNCDLDVGYVAVFPFAGTDPSSIVLPNDWTPGQGDNENKSYIRLEQSSDGGQTWTKVRGIASAQERETVGYQPNNVFWNDYFAPTDGDTLLYRARTVRFTSDYIPNRVPSALSPVTLTAGDPAADSGSYLFSLSEPGVFLDLHLTLPFTTTRKKRASVKTSLSGKPVIHYGGISGFDGTLNIECVTKEEIDLVKRFDAQQETMIFKRYDGQVQFIGFPDDLPVEQAADDYWRVSIPFIETAEPAEEE